MFDLKTRNHCLTPLEGYLWHLYKIHGLALVFMSFSAQAAGLLCEEAGNYMDNVKYCGYCPYHYQKLVRNLFGLSRFDLK